MCVDSPTRQRSSICANVAVVETAVEETALHQMTLFKQDYYPQIIFLGLMTPLHAVDDNIIELIQAKNVRGVNEGRVCPDNVELSGTHSCNC